MQPHSSLSNFSVVIWNKNQGSKEWGRVWCFTVVPCDGFWLCLALTLWLCQPYSACACRKSTLHFTAEAEWKLVLVINYPIIIIGGEPTTSQIPQLPVLCPGSCLGAVGTAWGVAAWRFRLIPCPLCWGLAWGRAFLGDTELGKRLRGATTCGRMLLLWAALTGHCPLGHSHALLVHQWPRPLNYLHCELCSISL